MKTKTKFILRGACVHLADAMKSLNLLSPIGL
jgi:hypothetical protein